LGIVTVCALPTRTKQNKNNRDIVNTLNLE